MKRLRGSIEQWKTMKFQLAMSKALRNGQRQHRIPAPVICNDSFFVFVLISYICFHTKGALHTFIRAEDLVTVHIHLM